MGPFGSPFTFTGEMMDGNGLVYLRARYYDPELGVFPSLDPVEGNMGQPMSLNRYGYVTGNVVNTADPSGKIKENPYQYTSCYQENLRNCTIWENLGFGEGDDFTYDDYTFADVSEIVVDKWFGSLQDVPSALSLPGVFLLGSIDAWPLEQLLLRTLQVSDLSTGDNYAEEMVNRFIAGTGGVFTHGFGSPLTQQVDVSQPFENLVNIVSEQIDFKMRTLLGSLNCAHLQLNDIDNLYFDKTDLAIGWPIGGTQGLRIVILKLNSWGLNAAYDIEYDMSIEFSIYDDFGVGENDLYVEPLVAFWMLQHVIEIEGNHRPFVNEIKVIRRVTGRY